MKSWGLGLVVLGVGVFVLPRLGRQFWGLNQLDPETQKIAGIAAIALGAVLFVVGKLKEKAAARRAKQG